MKKILLAFMLSFTFFAVGCGTKETVCTEHFTGSNCDTETPPQYVIVNQVRAIAYFVTVQPKNIYVILRDGALTTHTQESTQVATGGNLWMDGRKFKVGAYTTLKIELRDGDTGKLLGTASAQAYQSGKRFATIVPVESGEVKYELNVSYEW